MYKSTLVALACCLTITTASCKQPPKVAAVGNIAPDFTLVDQKGKTWTLTQLKGRVVFINFWATWCPPCREEMPSMQRLSAMLPQDRFVMLAVLQNDDPARADDFAAKLGITVPILFDRDKKVGPLYGLTGVPETFIVDKQGVIREKIIGPAEWDAPEVLKMLGKYLNQ